MFAQNAKDEEEKKAMKTLKLKDLNKATAKANEEEERKAKKAKAAPPPEADDTDEEESEDEEDDAPAPPPEADDTDEEESEDEEDDAPESEPAPKAKRKVKAKPAPVEEEDDAEEDEDDAPESEPAPKAKRTPKAAALPLPASALASATAAPDHILQFFGAAGRKGEAKVVATAFAELAEHLSNNLPRNPERGQCLRKLLEASDCATRAIEGEA